MSFVFFFAQVLLLDLCYLPLLPSELLGKFDPTTKLGVHWGRENIGITQ